MKILAAIDTTAAVSKMIASAATDSIKEKAEAIADALIYLNAPEGAKKKAALKALKTSSKKYAAAAGIDSALFVGATATKFAKGITKTQVDEIEPAVKLKLKQKTAGSDILKKHRGLTSRKGSVSGKPNLDTTGLGDWVKKNAKTKHKLSPTGTDTVSATKLSTNYFKWAESMPADIDTIAVHQAGETFFVDLTKPGVFEWLKSGTAEIQGGRWGAFIQKLGLDTKVRAEIEFTSSKGWGRSGPIYDHTVKYTGATRNSGDALGSGGRLIDRGTDPEKAVADWMKYTRN